MEIQPFDFLISLFIEQLYTEPQPVGSKSPDLSISKQLENDIQQLTISYEVNWAAYDVQQQIVFGDGRFLTSEEKGLSAFFEEFNQYLF
jgi:hypothetical protein